jgi:hypothetical protein
MNNLKQFIGGVIVALCLLAGVAWFLLPSTCNQQASDAATTGSDKTLQFSHSNTTGAPFYWDPRCFGRGHR